MDQMTVMMINWVKFTKLEIWDLNSVPLYSQFHVHFLWCILKRSSKKQVKKTHINITISWFFCVCSWVNAFSVPLVLCVSIVVSCVWCRDMCRYVWEKGEGKAWERRRREKEESEFYFLSNCLPRIVNVNYERARTVTHFVMSRELTEVHSKGLFSSFVSVGITFRSTPCISAPTF